MQSFSRAFANTHYVVHENQLSNRNRNIDAVDFDSGASVIQKSTLISAPARC